MTSQIHVQSRKISHESLGQQNPKVQIETL